MIATLGRCWLLQPRVLGLGLLQDGDVGVGVFPEGEEVLVGGAGFGSVVLQDVGAGNTEMSERSPWGVEDNVAVVEDFLKLRGCLFALMRGEVGLAADVGWIQVCTCGLGA